MHLKGGSHGEFWNIDKIKTDMAPFLDVDFAGNNIKGLSMQ